MIRITSLRIVYNIDRLAVVATPSEVTSQFGVLIGGLDAAVLLTDKNTMVGCLKPHACL